MPAKFVVKKGPTGKFRFNVVAANGQVIATSEAYETKRAALAGIKSVQKVAAEPAATVEDQTTKEWAEQAAASKAAAKAKKAAKKAKTAVKRVSPRKKAADSGAAAAAADAGGDTATS